MFGSQARSAERAWWESGRLTVLLIVGLVLAAAGAFVVARERDKPGPEAAAVAVARTQAVNFFTLDYRNPAKSVDRILALATGTFAKEFTSQRKNIENALPDQKLIVTASIPRNGSALEQIKGRNATVIVVVDTVSKSVNGVRERTYRTRLSLIKRDQGWLVNDIRQVGA